MIATDEELAKPVPGDDCACPHQQVAIKQDHSAEEPTLTFTSSTND